MSRSPFDVLNQRIKPLGTTLQGGVVTAIQPGAGTVTVTVLGQSLTDIRVAGLMPSVSQKVWVMRDGSSYVAIAAAGTNDGALRVYNSFGNHGGNIYNVDASGRRALVLEASTGTGTGPVIGLYSDADPTYAGDIVFYGKAFAEALRWDDSTGRWELSKPWDFNGQYVYNVTLNNAMNINGQNLVAVGNIASNNPGGGSVDLDWEDNYWRFRFGGTGTPQGLRIDNYDTPAIQLGRTGFIEITRDGTGDEGGYIDLKDAYAEDFDVRLMSTGGSAPHLHVVTPSGEVTIGARNASYAHLYTDRPTWAIDKTMTWVVQPTIATNEHAAFFDQLSSYYELGRNFSGARFKKNIRGWEKGSNPRALLDVALHSWEWDTDAIEAKVGKRISGTMHGMIADELADLAPNLVTFDEEGRPESIKDGGPLTNQIILTLQHLDKRLAALEKK